MYWVLAWDRRSAGPGVSTRPRRSDSAGSTTRQAGGRGPRERQRAGVETSPAAPDGIDVGGNRFGRVVTSDDSRRVAVLLGLLFGFAGMGSSSAAVAVPLMADDLGVSTGLATWTISLYVLFLAITTAVYGRISDLVGTRLPLLVGIGADDRRRARGRAGAVVPGAARRPAAAGRGGRGDPDHGHHPHQRAVRRPGARPGARAAGRDGRRAELPRPAAGRRRRARVGLAGRDGPAAAGAAAGAVRAAVADPAPQQRHPRRRGRRARGGHLGRRGAAPAGAGHRLRRRARRRRAARRRRSRPPCAGCDGGPRASCPWPWCATAPWCAARWRRPRCRRRGSRCSSACPPCCSARARSRGRSGCCSCRAPSWRWWCRGSPPRSWCPWARPWPWSAPRWSPPWRSGSPRIGAALVSHVVLGVAVVLVTTAFGVGQPAMGAAVADAVPSEVRGVALGIGTLLFLVGGSLGSAVVGGLGPVFGIAGSLAVLMAFPVAAAVAARPRPRGRPCDRAGAGHRPGRVRSRPFTLRGAVPVVGCPSTPSRACSAHVRTTLSAECSTSSLGSPPGPGSRPPPGRWTRRLHAPSDGARRLRRAGGPRRSHHPRRGRRPRR